MTHLRFGILVGVTLIGSLLGGMLSSRLLFTPVQAQTADRVIAHELRLVDESGRTRILLSLLREKPRLIMLDEKGEFRIELGMAAGGEPALWLRDKDGAPRAQLGLTPIGNPGLEYTDAAGNNRSTLALNHSGSPTLLFRDEAAKDRLALWQEKGQMGLALADEEGRPRVGVSLNKGRNGSLALYDESKKVIWLAPGKQK